MVFRVAIAAAVLATAGLACAPSDPDPPGATTGPDPVAPTVTLPARSAERTGSVAAEAPTGVRLPSGRRVAVIAVGTRTNGVLDVPSDVRSAGWWSGGSRVGDPFGSTLLAGHVDSTDQGLGAYAELLGVRPDEPIRLSSNHLVQEFVVESLRLIDKSDVRRARLSWVGGGRRLTLVTCAPPYDAARGGYQRLAVVTARPVADPAARETR